MNIVRPFERCVITLELYVNKLNCGSFKKKHTDCFSKGVGACRKGSLIAEKPGPPALLLLKCFGGSSPVLINIAV